ncbi:MAG: hypothetical protein [Inoviridae sp.]|nr:MAG: hypothetical protein [Inoviridae sp.]
MYSSQVKYNRRKYFSYKGAKIMNTAKTVQAHLHIDVYRKPETAKRVKELIVKRKLNSLMIKLLEEHFKKEPIQKDLF